MNGLKSKSTFRLLLVLSWLLGDTLWGGAATGEEKTLVFPEMAGWKQDGKPQVFSPQTLYEYINGEADLYLTYEFQDLNVAEYKGGGKAAVTVEVYRHGDSTKAFGIYSQERLADARFLDLGAQGYQEPNVLNFVAGPYYVKISGYSTGADPARGHHSPCGVRPGVAIGAQAGSSGDNSKPATRGRVKPGHRGRAETGLRFTA